VGGGLLLVEGPSRLSQRGSERRCSAIVSGGAARSRLELSHAPTSTSIHLPACSASDRFLVWTIRPGCLPPPLPALNPINNAVGSRLRASPRYRADDSRRRGSRGFRGDFREAFLRLDRPFASGMIDNDRRRAKMRNVFRKGSA